MRKILILTICLAANTMMGADCTNAYASASYSLSHAKRSLNANNFDHQQYYAGRALEAFEKARGLVVSCGCEGSMDAILDGIEHLNDALDPKDWDMGRYYTKKAVADAEALLSALDTCTQGASPSVENIPHEDVVSVEDMSPVADQPKRPEELDAQLELKRMAEITQVEFVQKWQELAKLTGCGQLPSPLNDLDKRTEDVIKAESLENTRSYYRDQFIRIQKLTLEAFLDCNGGAD